MIRKSIFRAVMITVLSLTMAVVFLPALGHVEKAYAKTATNLKLTSAEEFTLPLADPDIDSLTCHLGDILTVTYDDNSSVDFTCTDAEYWKFTSEANQTITLSPWDWIDEPDEFKAGETYEAYALVLDTGGVEGVTKYEEVDTHIPVKIVNDDSILFIKSIDLALDSGEILQLQETADRLYNAMNVNCHEGDKLTVYYSGVSEPEIITADEDGDFYSTVNKDYISIYFEWVKADGVEIDDNGMLSGTTGESYDAYVFAYKGINTHNSGEEVYSTNSTGERITFPVKIVGTEAPRDYVVTGGTEDTDYTYQDGVLQFLKDGSYTVSMREGLVEAQDTIEIHGGGDNPGFNGMDLTLDNLNINTGDKLAVEGFFGNRTNNFNLNLILKGTNRITSNTLTWQNHTFNSNLTVSAESGKTSDSLLIETGPTNPNDNDFSVDNFTLKSGELSFDATTRSAGPGKEIGMTANKVFRVDGGELHVTSPEPAGAVYCNGQFIMTGGDVTIKTSGSCCIQVVGTADVAGDGVIINGGNLTLTSEATSGSGTILVGNNKQKNIVIDTDGEVRISSKYIGIAAQNNSNITMKKGYLGISPSFIGCYLSSGSRLTFAGGETEIASSYTGLYVAVPSSNFNYNIYFDSNYSHKNYDGDSSDKPAEVSDTGLLPLHTSSGKPVSQKYVLVTPAYPITYDLNDGTLPEGKENPKVYTRIDSIQLNNPSKEGHDFTGWTGIGLDTLTETVTIPIEGVTGALSFEANYKLKKHLVKFDTGEGASEVPDQTIEHGSKIDTSLVDPVKDGYSLEGWYEDEELTKAFDLNTSITEAKTLYAKWTEKQVTITYVAGNGGNVSPKSESVNVITGTAQGSTATADSGYDFIAWTDSQGETVSKSPTFVPKKKDGKYTSEVYVASFAESGSGSGGDEIAVIPSPPKMTYNGKPQTAYSNGKGYTVKNGTATNAGTHTAVFTLKDGYSWADGTTGSKKVSYKIAKATLIAKYVGETIEWYEKPAMKVKVTGFVNGETAKTAKGYTAPVAKAPKFKRHATYKVKPSKGSASNYKFKYKKGKLTVNCKTVIIGTIKAGKNKASVSWNKVPGASGYKIYGCQCGKDYELLKTVKGQKLKTDIKITKKANYKFYVTAYRVQNGKTITLSKSPSTHVMMNNAFENHSNPTDITVDKKSVTISKGKTAQVKGTVVSKKKPLSEKHTAYVRYKSSDVHIAKVDANGKITGKKKGTCKIYVLTQNGIWKAVDVTVK